MYRYVFMFPVFMFLIFIICLINSTFSKEVVLESLLTYGNLNYSLVTYIVSYLVNIFFFSAFYINLALIVIRKEHNYFLVCIKTFLLIIAIELFLEIIVGGFIFSKIFDSSIGLVFNILNGFTFNLSNANILITLLFSFSCFLISSIVVYFQYRNKEELVMDCEKNN